LAGLLEKHPTRGYRWTPGFHGELPRGDETVRIETNSMGLRDEELSTEPEGPRLLAIGDSFTVGFGVEAEEAWPEVLEAILRQSWGLDVEVANAGVSGYSLEQIRVTAEELVPELTPAAVVVGVYPGAAWRLRNPNVALLGRLVNQRDLGRLRIEGDSWFYAPYDRSWLRRLHWWSARHSRVGFVVLQGVASLRERLKANEASDADTAAAVAAFGPEIAKLRELCDQSRIPLIVLLVLPQAGDGSFAPKDLALHTMLREELTAAGLIVADPLHRFRSVASTVSLRFPDDHHWTPLAHSLAAESVVEALRRTELWPPNAE
jgi:hypothetical protein